MHIFDLVTQISNQLIGYYKIPSLTQQYAWWIIETVTHKRKAELIALREINLNKHQKNVIDSWIHKQLKENIPLPYLLGTIPFGELTLLVEPPVLLPRPETEEWVHRLIKELMACSSQVLQILDIGTGSGCIGLSFAYALPKSHVWCIDTSNYALKLAKKNAAKNHIKNITFKQSDIFNNLSTNLKFDLIVSNPPYINPSEWSSLDRSITQWEDKNALIAQKNGYAILQKIIEEAPAYLRYNNCIHKKHIDQLYLEIGHQQAKVVSELMLKTGYSCVCVHKDLYNRDRVVSGQHAIL